MPENRSAPHYVSIVVPAFNEERLLDEFLEKVVEVLEKHSIDFEIIVIDDGSQDSSWHTLREWASIDPRIRGLRLSRNFGKESAICAGLSFAEGAAVVVMDADLQHPPDVIPELIKNWSEGYFVVNARKRFRGRESWLSNLSARGFYSVFGVLCGFDLRDQSDFKLLDRRVVEAWLEMGERNLFFRGMAAWLGFRNATVDFDVETRPTGGTRWSQSGLLNLAVSALTGFSSIPLRLVTFVGLVFLVFALALAGQTIYKWASGEALEGFTTVIMTVLIATSVLMLALGVIGEYLARMYDEIKARPRFVVEDRLGFESNLDHTRRSSVNRSAPGS